MGNYQLSQSSKEENNKAPSQPGFSNPLTNLNLTALNDKETIQSGIEEVNSSALPESIGSVENLKVIIFQYDQNIFKNIKDELFNEWYRILSGKFLISKESISDNLGNLEKYGIPPGVITTLKKWSTPPEEKKKEQEGEKSFF